jgi:hypothetical protein
MTARADGIFSVSHRSSLFLYGNRRRRLPTEYISKEKKIVFTETKGQRKQEN